MFIIGLIYFVWVISQFIEYIILLNFLIAVIGQSYDKVIGHTLETVYGDRALINRDFNVTRKEFNNFNCLPKMSKFTMVLLSA